VLDLEKKAMPMDNTPGALKEFLLDTFGD